VSVRTELVLQHAFRSQEFLRYDVNRSWSNPASFE